MPYMKLHTVAAVVAVCITPMGHAVEMVPADDPTEKKSWMEEPMSTKMMREGMVKGDVSKAAEKKAQKMQPMIEREEKSMSAEKAEP